jgi:hypothetical protein
MWLVYLVEKVLAALVVQYYLTLDIEAAATPPIIVKARHDIQSVNQILKGFSPLLQQKGSEITTDMRNNYLVIGIQCRGEIGPGPTR